MAASTSPEKKGMTTGSKVGFGVGGSVVALLGIVGSWIAGLIGFLALTGTPLFAVMGGSGELAWLAKGEKLRLIATKVIDQHFSDSPVLVTIPLFTFVGYVLTESKTPDRLVDAARALFGWLPGGLAIVCIIASAIFTVLTGGSGVTIIAIGGLLYPALRKQKYSDKFSLGLVTTGGSVGLLLPYSLPLLVYCLVTTLPLEMGFKAVLAPGVMVIVMLGLYSAWVGIREKVQRDRPKLSDIKRSLWALKWELLIPVILIVGLQSKLTRVDEAGGLVAAYVVVIEFFVYKDLNWKKDLPRIAKASMSLAGAIILILAMANTMMHYVTAEKVPEQFLELLLKLGIKEKWQFLLVMNLFLLVLGMLMEGFSAILIAVPLIVPFVARLPYISSSENPDFSQSVSPFQLAMIFILNLELAYCVPPLGLNLFISSFRFNRSVTSLYRVVLPFAGILAIGLLLVSYVPVISNIGVRSDIQAIRAKGDEADRRAKADGLPTPSQDRFVLIREAWKLECVQEDPNNPQPCTAADWKEFPKGQIAVPAPTIPTPGTAPTEVPTADPSAECNPAFEDCSDRAPPAPSGSVAPKGSAATTGSAAPPASATPEPCNPALGDCP